MSTTAHNGHITPQPVKTPGGAKIPRKHGRRGSRTSDNGDSEISHYAFFLDNRLPLQYFKQDILKLIHTLKVPRWRRWVDSEMGSDIEVTRLSGALTNAIYAVSAPDYIKDRVKYAYANDPALQTRKSYHHWMPPKLLLRVYGPQVGHLIDRDVELAVLSRLALKDIGPRLLGTFTNGRFEQFLDAQPLTKDDLRDSDVSVQIAKRMRELHDNVPLLPSERVRGPTVWVNYDKWLIRAIDVLELLESKKPGTIKSILQADLPGWSAMVRKYRDWLTKEYGGETAIKQELAFTHNDTQYGNILRFNPPAGSPLLQPRNEHRQLVVIDFEYSAANVRGYDIANHFCEWMNDYHDEERPHHIWAERFPNKEQQQNHVQGYVEHGLDSFEDDERIDREVAYILKQARDWRPSVHLYWCIWGIVQAVDEKEDRARRELEDAAGGYSFKSGSPDDKEVAAVAAAVAEAQIVAPSPTLSEEPEDEQDLFDYIAYATEKAELFWSDMIKFGLLDAKDYEGQVKMIPA